MKKWLKTLSPIILMLIIVCSVHVDVSAEEAISDNKSPLKEDIKRAEQLGEEFQRQMPWSRQRQEGGAYYAPSQPEGYLFTPERELPDAEDITGKDVYMYCYNPYILRYEHCRLEDYYRDYHDYYKYRYRFRLHLPGFDFYWGDERRCPPGQHWKPGIGCHGN